MSYDTMKTLMDEDHGPMGEGRYRIVLHRPNGSIIEASDLVGVCLAVIQVNQDALVAFEGPRVMTELAVQAVTAATVRAGFFIHARSGLAIGAEYAGLGGTCMVCGCTDEIGCDPPCSWALIDYFTGKGVCTTCEDMLNEEPPDAR